MNLFRSLKRRKELGSIVGEKVSPLPNREISSEDSECEDKLNIFIVSVILRLFLDLLCPPLHPRLCVFFLSTACNEDPSLKKKKRGLQSGGYFATLKIT